MRYRFEDCVLDTDRHELLKNGQCVEIEPQVFDLLHLLVSNAGSLVSKDQIIERVWAGRIVAESSISARISATRRAVGDNGKDQAIIKTIAKRGLQFVAPIAPEPELARPPAKPVPTARPVVKYAKSADGAMIAYSVVGTGPPLFRLAHFPSSIEDDWDDPLDQGTLFALSERYTLIRFDYRGSGLSKMPVNSCHPAISADDLLAVADAAGVERFSVFGLSGGAMAAVHLAAKHPDRVDRLILQSGYVDGRSIRGKDGENPGSDAIESMISEGWDKPDSPFISGFINIYLPGVTRQQARRAAAAMIKSTSAETAELYRKTMNNTSIAELLPKLKMPTLIMHSKDDAVHPLSEAQKLASGIANARLVVLDSPNHYILQDEPCWAEHLRAIYDFLD